MGLARLLPRAEMLVVTTPSLAASRVARRAVSMARNNYLRVIGVVENLSSYVAPDGSNHEIFGSGGGEFLAHKSGVPLLGNLEWLMLRHRWLSAAQMTDDVLAGDYASVIFDDAGRVTSVIRYAAGSTDRLAQVQESLFTFKRPSSNSFVIG